LLCSALLFFFPLRRRKEKGGVAGWVPLFLCSFLVYKLFVVSVCFKLILLRELTKGERKGGRKKRNKKEGKLMRGKPNSKKTDNG